MPEPENLWRNTLLMRQHAHRRELLRKHFPALSSCRHDNYLSLAKFFTQLPWKFLDQDAFLTYYNLLESIHKARPDALRRYVKDHSWRLSQSLQYLEECSKLSWHDEVPTGDDYELFRFVDSAVHPAYLRILEGSYHPFIHLISFFSRLDRNKGTEDLDLYNSVQELAKTAASFVANPFNNTIRNGIAHGAVAMGHFEIKYTDIKGNLEERSPREIIRLFDDLLDITHSLAMAFSLFLLTRSDQGYAIPLQLLINELHAETQSPWWEVLGCIPSKFQDTTQLIIFVRADTRDPLRVRYFTLLTAVLAEELARGYGRYFISIRSLRALPGCAAYDGAALARARESNPQTYDDYKEVFSSETYMYFPHFTPPRLFLRLNVLAASISESIRFGKEEFLRRQGKPTVVGRHASMHRSGFFSILNAAVVIEAPSGSPDLQMVRRACPTILREALRLARAKLPTFAPARVLPIGWARIAVFRKDYRERRLKGFGLGADLICTIQVQSDPRVRVPDILESAIERRGRFRIAWNKAWLEDREG